MKKFLSILLAGFIGFLGIFTTTSTAKNSAEPQYFFQTERKNAANYENNTINFYFDNSLNYFNDLELNIGTINSNATLYYLNTDNEKIFGYNLTAFENQTFKFSATEEYNYFLFGEEGSFISKLKSDISAIGVTKNIWYFLDPSSGTPIAYVINGFSIEGLTLTDSISNINKSLQNFIGDYIPSIDQETNKNTTIEQIGNIISDTTNWFVNIFIGLSEVFYSNGTLGVWGSVLFLGVAFTLITMCLKWVISLIRGI